MRNGDHITFFFSNLTGVQVVKFKKSSSLKRTNVVFGELSNKASKISLFFIINS